MWGIVKLVPFLFWNVHDLYCFWDATSCFFGTKEEIVLALTRSGFGSKKLQISRCILVTRFCGDGMFSKIVECLSASTIIQLSPSSLTRKIFANIFAAYVY